MLLEPPVPTILIVFIYPVFAAFIAYITFRREATSSESNRLSVQSSDITAGIYILTIPPLSKLKNREEFEGGHEKRKGKEEKEKNTR